MCKHGLSRFGGLATLYVAYLDEFGHIGPFISRIHPEHRTSPIFGLGGIVLPSDRVRGFATWFFKLKCNLLKFEIERSGVPPREMGEKGRCPPHDPEHYEIPAAKTRCKSHFRSDRGGWWFCILPGYGKASHTRREFVGAAVLCCASALDPKTKCAVYSG